MRSTMSCLTASIVGASGVGISAYARQAMAWAHQNGLVQGSNNALNPKQNATRAQVAAIPMRYCQNVAK
ncbi:MAG: S-layer homology domain-containing protein [Clostridia bacterium]